MNKGILISIRPKWCELIANGKKTVEVRKTRPKLDTPFKCYIYCTKASKKYQTNHKGLIATSDELHRHPTQGIKHGDPIKMLLCDEYSEDNFLNGKVFGEFVCDSINKIFFDSDIRYGEDFPNEYISKICNDSCLSLQELKRYANGKDVFGWHISDFVIYDKPKELHEFRAPCQERMYCDTCRYSENVELPFGEISVGCDRTIMRPPMSWCYVEKLQCQKA